jgi:hypothetical protein
MQCLSTACMAKGICPCLHPSLWHCHAQGHLRTSTKQGHLRTSTKQAPAGSNEPTAALQASQASEASAPATIPLPILTTLGGTPPAVPPSAEALPAGWKLLEVPHVQLFGMFNLPWIAQNYHFNPAGSLNSGHFNMIYTSRQLSKPEGIKLLLASEEGKHLGLDGVEMSTFKALMFEPLESGTTVMLDGEVVPFQPLYVEVHPGLCTVVVAPEWQA